MDRPSLIENLPPFMRQFCEMREIMGADEKELNRLYEHLNRTLENAFIDGADTEGIARFEHQMDIEPDLSDSLETRRARVLLRWNETVPYTLRVLYAQLDALCGVDDYEVKADLQHYHLEITAHLPETAEVEELERFCKKILPENICYGLVNCRIHTANSVVYSGGVMAEKRKTISVRQGGEAT